MGINLERGHIEMVKDKMQFTIEREPDFLFKVRHDNPLEDYITQFDFQVGNDMEMPDRMLFYRTLAKFVHKLPIRQIVFYIGYAPLAMVNFLKEPKLYFEYELYDIRIFKANSFLESTIPQEVLLAILGDFEKQTPEEIMEKILFRLNALVRRKKDLQKLTFQLRILCGLRKLRKIYQQKIKTMPLVFDIEIETDPFYLEGVEAGEQKGKKDKATLMVEKLLLQRKRSIKYIANFVEEAEDFVRSIQQRLIQEGRLVRPS
jgi:hypothetical protein